MHANKGAISIMKAYTKFTLLCVTIAVTCLLLSLPVILFYAVVDQDSHEVSDVYLLVCMSSPLPMYSSGCNIIIIVDKDPNYK